MTDEDRSTPAAASDLLDNKTLFVRSIPFDATSDELSDFFSQFCPIKHAVIVNDHEGNSRGFGFVSFTMDDDTATALEQARKTKFKNRLLRVDIAKRRDRKKDSEDVTTLQQQHREKRETVEKRKPRLIIRNMPWSVRDAAELKKIFGKYGAVADAYIPKKKDGKMSGFAFVTMKKFASAEAAIKGSEGLKIGGREVAVDFALEKAKWLEYKDEHADELEGESESEDEEDSDAEASDIEEDDIKNEADEQNSEDADVANEDSDESDIDLDSDEEVDAEEEEEHKVQRPKQNKQESYSVFVRNIPYDTESESLKEHFEQFGDVKYALPVTDKETGQAKGTAFVAFYKEEAYKKCLEGAPESSTTSMLISDDVSPAYVYEGRILSITPTVNRENAARLTEKNAQKRSELLGKAPGEKDRRNMYLLNEGRITEHSKLAAKLTKSDLEIREKSYKLRVQQLNNNPSLHLSMTRLAIRNLPRAMTAKSLKALGRHAVVQFATEVKEGKRQPLSKEEVIRSVKEKERLLDGEEESKRSKKQGVIRQAKIIMEVKGSGEAGRSRGYGFLEFRDHKSALMGLRWLNAHAVTQQELLEGLDEEEKKLVLADGPVKKRNLVVEFAIEHANVVKRRKEKMAQAKKSANENKRSRDDGDTEQANDADTPKSKKQKRGPKKQGNNNKGAHVGKKGAKPAASTDDKKKGEPTKSGLDDETKKLIGMKRKRRQNKKGGK